MAMLNNQMVPKLAKLAKLAYSLFDRCFAHGEKKCIVPTLPPALPSAVLSDPNAELCWRHSAPFSGAAK